MTEIEAIERKIANLRADLAKEEARLASWMADSKPPESIYGIKTMEDVQRQLYRGCWLANYTPGRIAVFEPNGGGSYGCIYGPLADELGAQYDKWNFDVHHARMATA